MASLLECTALQVSTNLLIFTLSIRATRLLLIVIPCELTQGRLPSKQLKLTTAWAEIHKEELVADRELASNGELPFPIEPLQ